MEYARMASGLLVRLCKEMNGAVVADMEGRGLHYPKNYGVSLHSIREAAKRHAPDHGFARHLWTQPVRELKLAAVSIADPAAVTVDETDFWMEGVLNGELAENLASFLLSRTVHSRQILEKYTESDNPLFVYTALLTGVKTPDSITAEEAILYVERIERHAPFTERAVALLLSRVGNTSETDHERMLKYIEDLRNSGDTSRIGIADEMMI